MNNEDLALFQRAEQLANNGQQQAAYELFRTLRDRHSEQIEILFWIVQTTPDIVESRQVLDAIKHMQPHHPLIPRTETFHNRKLQTIYVPISPILLCPYCGSRAHALVRSKTATAGWVVLIVLLIICFPLCWIGLLFQEKYYVCSYCGSQIAVMR